MTWLRIVITLSFIAYLIYLSDFALAASIRPKTIKPVPKAENFTLYIVIPVLNEEQVTGRHSYRYWLKFGSCRPISPRGSLL